MAPGTVLVILISSSPILSLHHAAFNLQGIKTNLGKICILRRNNVETSPTVLRAHAGIETVLFLYFSYV